MCLGSTEVLALCADNLSFCSITSGDVDWYFMYLNGIVGFAPPPADDTTNLKARSFMM